MIALCVCSTSIGAAAPSWSQLVAAVLILVDVHTAMYVTETCRSEAFVTSSPAEGTIVCNNVLADSANSICADTSVKQVDDRSIALGVQGNPVDASGLSLANETDP